MSNWGMASSSFKAPPAVALSLDEKFESRVTNRSSPSRIISMFSVASVEPIGSPRLMPSNREGATKMTGPFTLSPLPYDADALEPVISAKTVGFHYHKHHQTYVDTLNKLVVGTPYADMKLEEVIQAALGKDGDKDKKIFNNAAQVWNHDFYWNSLATGPTILSGKLKDAVERDFGDAKSLIKELAAAGKEQFGSGWAW